MKFKYLLLATVLIATLAGCKDKSSTSRTEDNNGDPVTLFQEDDKAMNAAIQKAKQNFDQFEKAFTESQGTDKYYGFTIKEGFATKDGGKEHMWVGDIQFDGKIFTGTLHNSPIKETDVKYGDKVTISKSNISDWMYTNSQTNKTYGGYTIRVMVDNMSSAEKSQFEKENGIDFAE